MNKKTVKKTKKYMHNKLAFIFIVVTLALLGVGVKTFFVSSENNESYARIVLDQQSYGSRAIQAQRGDITDRYGTVLATNEKYYTAILDPEIMMSTDSNAEYYDITVQTLVEIFDVDETELRAAIEAKPNSHYVKFSPLNHLSEEQMTAFTERQDDINAEATEANSMKQVQGVTFETHYERVYPYNSLACNVLGFSTDEENGNYGIEQYYNDELTGTEGRSYGYYTGTGQSEYMVVDAEDGNTICSTIDATVQQVVEQQIDAFQQSVGANMIACIVMDPNTGEVLAMATSNDYDLNDPYNLSAYYEQSYLDSLSETDYSSALSSIWKNYCISESFEPGSTAKVFTVAAAVEQGLIDPATFTSVCDGGENFAGDVRVSCHLKTGHGTINVYQALAYSCNDSMMYLARLCGPTVLCEYLQNFNIGSKTGIDLPAEERGIVYEPDQITDLTLCTNSFGQNYNTTMIQMAAAYCSVINGGNYYVPHVVNRIVDADGNVVKTIEPELVRQTVTEETSQVIRDSLLQAVQYGTGKSAAVAGYNVACKTGTAQKIPRSENNYVQSAMAFVPYDDPQVLVYCVFDTPHVDDQSAGGYGAQMAGAILSGIVDHLGIYPDDQAAADAAEAQAAAEAANAEAAANAAESYESGIYENGNDDATEQALIDQQAAQNADTSPQVDDN